MTAWKCSGKAWRFLRLLSVISLACGSQAADVKVKVADKEPPGEVDVSIKKVLQTQSVQLLEGDKIVWEFWFNRELPLQSKPDSAAKALETLKQTALLGVAKLASDQRDYRDDAIVAATYTMRFALQPQDGNHLGTAEFPYFAVLTPAKLDTKLDGITDYKALVKLSSKESSSDHPVILSLRPVKSEGTEFPKLAQPAPEHESVTVKVPAKIPAGDQKTSIVLDLVYKGKGNK